MDGVRAGAARFVHVFPDEPGRRPDVLTDEPPVPSADAGWWPVRHRMGCGRLRRPSGDVDSFGGSGGPFAVHPGAAGPNRLRPARFAVSIRPPRPGPTPPRRKPVIPLDRAGSAPGRSCPRSSRGPPPARTGAGSSQAGIHYDREGLRIPAPALAGTGFAGTAAMGVPAWIPLPYPLARARAPRSTGEARRIIPADRSSRPRPGAGGAGPRRGRRGFPAARSA